MMKKTNFIIAILSTLIFIVISFTFPLGWNKYEEVTKLSGEILLLPGFVSGVVFIIMFVFIIYSWSKVIKS